MINLENFNSGAGIPTLNQNHLHKLKIKIHSKEEQQQIAAILTAYDDLIETNNQRIATLEQLAQQIYKEWFVRMRFPGWEHTPVHHGIPEGWTVKPLSDFCKFVMGQSPSSEFYNEDGNGLPFHQGVSFFNKRFPRHIVFCNTEGRIAEKGDILFSVRAPVGRINIATDKLIIGRGLAAIRHTENFQNFLYHLLSIYFLKEDIIGNGAIFNSVSKNELEDFKAMYPPIDLIVQFTEIVKPMDDQIEILIKQNKNLTKTRNLLLPRLISGKLSLKQSEATLNL